MKWIPGRMASILSSSAYQSALAVGNWVSLPRKLEESIEYRRSWHDYLRTKTFPERAGLWLHGASVGELEDLAAFFLDPAVLAESGYRPDDLIVTASSISAQSQLERWSRRAAFRYMGPLPPERSSEVREFLGLLRPERLLLSHVDLWPVALQKSGPTLRKGVLWLPARAKERNHWLRESCLDPFVKVVGSRYPTSTLEDFSFNSPSGVDLHFVGNLRIDRIIRRIDEARSHQEHVLQAYDCAPRPERFNIVMGSAWKDDAETLEAALKLLAPHELERLSIVVIPHETDDAVEVATLHALLPQARVLAVKGVLVEAYRDFDWAWVGGGFRTGLHNVLEPALWGVPVVCGPRSEKQPSTDELRALGLLDQAATPAEAAALLRRAMANKVSSNLDARARRATEAFSMHVGAAHRLAKLLANDVGA